MSNTLDFTWTDENSDYMTSLDADNLHSPVNHRFMHSSRDTSLSGNEILSSAGSAGHRISRNASPQPPIIIPPMPFTTPPKLKTVEYVMNNNSGTDVASLRNLTTALARDAIFGRKEMAKKSLSGRNETRVLDSEKLNYIKTLVRSRVSEKPRIEFEHTWALCRNSLSISCQTLRNSYKKKNCQ